MGFLARLFRPAAPPSPRLRDLMERLDLLEADVTGLRKKVARLQGIVTGGLRSEKDETPQDAPGPTNGDGVMVTPGGNRFRALRGF